VKTIMKKLICVTFLAMASLATGQAQSATTELHVKDIRAQQPPEKLAASPLCQRAFEGPNHGIIQRTSVDPTTLVHDLAALLEKSDEVVLVGTHYRSESVFSPSGESAATYYDVKVIRSWKGTHAVGDNLTFSVPAGAVHCGMTESNQSVYVSTMNGTIAWNVAYDGPYLLFLRHPQGKETQLVETLFPAAGGGLQGIFPISFPVSGEEISKCTGLLPDTLQWCDSFLETSRYPVVVPYVPDPLGKKYDGMPVADFLNVVRNLAADQGLDEKRP
jgi:hypothetical protein